MAKKKPQWKIEQKGRGKRRCRRCKNDKGLIRKYGLYLCRRCFKDNAQMMGFKKYS